MNERMTVDGVEIYIDGEGTDTLVMIHGWPDNHRIWQHQVAHFRQTHRCVTFTLPGFEAPSGGRSLEAIVGVITRIIDRVSPQQPVILMVHDWGCVFGYEYAMRNAQRVARMIAIDIGDSGSPEFQRSLGVSAKLMVLSYQMILACGWYLPRPVGDRLTRGLAKALRSKTPAEEIHGGMNYPYAMRWMNALDGLGALRPVEPSFPFFFAYARKKPFMFHSREWQARISAMPGNRVQDFNCGHWVMVDEAAAFNQAVDGWLRGEG